MAQIAVPGPPNEEQRRIVAKVDQLMALCDELENGQQQRSLAQLHLNDAALDHLLAARDPDEFATHWQRLRDNFDLLYDTPETISKLRGAILQLAVQGKLVPQDPNDEPASTHAIHTRMMQAQLPINGRNIRTDGCSSTSDAKDRVGLPAGWTSLTIEQACSHIVDCLHSTPKFTEQGYYCIDTTCISPGRIHFDRARRVNRETFLDRIRRLQPQEGDVLFSREGTIGISVVVPAGVELCLGQRMMMYRLHKFLDSHYFVYFLSSPLFVANLFSNTTGTAAKHVNIGDIRKLRVLVPPLREQRRIVAKVDQLMALCDGFDAKLKQAQVASEALLEAVVQQVLAKDVEVA